MGKSLKNGGENEKIPQKWWLEWENPSKMIVRMGKILYRLGIKTMGDMGNSLWILE